MKMNPNIVKDAKSLQSLDYKTMKASMKKELKRLEKNTTADAPTQVIIIAEHDYPDKAKMPLVLFGKWKGDIKDFAKKEAGNKNPEGAIGQAYFGGQSPDGQKIVKLDLAKGKAKGKAAKIKKALNKLIPQATHNVVMGEISENALDALEQKLDQMPEVEEAFEAIDTADAGQVDLDDNQKLKDILAANLAEIQTAANVVRTQIAPRIKERKPQADDADIVIDASDLVDEWLELYEEANPFVKPFFITYYAQVKVLQAQITPVLDALKKLGVNPSNGKMPAAENPAPQPQPNVETPPAANNVATPPAGNNPIKQSVGDKNGVNDPADVVTIQNLLRAKGYTNVQVTGNCDDATKAAIHDYQKTKMGNPKHDGRVDPDGRTWKSLSSSTTNTNTNTNNGGVDKNDYTGATKGFRPQDQQNLDWETETEREKKLEEFFDTFTHIKVRTNPGQEPAQYVEVVPSYEINSTQTKDPQGNPLPKSMDLAKWGDTYVTGKAGAIRRKLPWHAKAGKATPKDIEWFLNECVKQGATSGYELTNIGLRKFLNDKQVGVDCTGLVSQAFNFLADGDMEYQKGEDSFAITSSMTGGTNKNNKFKAISSPSGVKAGDMMKLEPPKGKKYGHVRIVVDVDTMPDGSIQVRTIESGGGGANSGVGATLWRYKNPGSFEGLERSDDNGTTWYGSDEHKSRTMTYQRWDKLETMPE